MNNISQYVMSSNTFGGNVDEYYDTESDGYGDEHLYGEHITGGGPYSSARAIMESKGSTNIFITGIMYLSAMIMVTCIFLIIYAEMNKSDCTISREQIKGTGMKVAVVVTTGVFLISRFYLWYNGKTSKQVASKLNYYVDLLDKKSKSDFTSGKKYYPEDLNSVNEVVNSSHNKLDSVKKRLNTKVNGNNSDPNGLIIQSSKPWWVHP